MVALVLSLAVLASAMAILVFTDPVRLAAEYTAISEPPTTAPSSGAAWDGREAR
jgi:hypothetical protein